MYLMTHQQNVGNGSHTAQSGSPRSRKNHDLIPGAVIALAAVVVAVAALPNSPWPESTAYAADPGNTLSTRPASAPSTAPAKLPRVVDLGADKCKACKKLAPILAQLKKEYAGRVKVEFIDVWKNRAAGAAYKIRVIPTQIFFNRDGKEVWRHEGFLPKAEFVAKFAELGVK